LKPLSPGYELGKLLALFLRQRLHVVAAEPLFEMARPLATLRQRNTTYYARKLH
jgi:hypothetical protein